MTPSGRQDEVLKSIYQGTGVNGLCDYFVPAREDYRNWIVVARFAYQTILGYFVFLFECSKYPVPYNQYTAVIFIQVAQRRGMMHPVMRRCVEDIFDNWR